MTTAELRELLERATPGEWFWTGYSQVQSSAEQDDEYDGPAVCYFDAEHGDTATERTKNNGLLIEKLHNVAPELLAIAEAALAVRVAFLKWSQAPSFTISKGDAWCAYEAARDALVSLSALAALEARP